MGAGVPGKYGKFYSCLDAYKTLNLLLMPGLDGEKVRVCQEHQIPNSIYIQQWRMTLDVLVDIFTAQCKYAVHVGQPPKKTLYRGDRGINYQLMKQHNQTFALTSTSLGGYQEKFVKGKKEDCVLEIVIDKNVPYFDYARFFGDAYVFFDEAEVLLPPYITMTKTHSYDCDNLTHHHIHLDRFDMTSIDADEDDLIHALEQDCQSAANEFQDFVENAQKNITMLPSSDGSYARWKENFQKLCKLCMQNIYRSYYEI